MDSSGTFYIYNREDWKKLRENASFSLTEKHLNSLRALNDVISLNDVEDIYVPVVELLDVYIKNFYDKQDRLDNYLNINDKNDYNPYIIGIAGSVSVGKSTVARLLKTLLNDLYEDKKVELITTDGFLYPNETLEEKGLMNRKGFPESYDMPRLVNFLTDVKNGKSNLETPKYSHEIYNIVPDEVNTIDRPDILIVEGINVLQLPSNENIFVSDFFDFSFYVDASEDLIRKWYLQRFGILLDTAFQEPKNYYNKFTDWKREEAFAYARDIWENVNLVNLKKYILPTRLRANLILHKTDNHYIDKILLKRY